MMGTWAKAIAIECEVVDSRNVFQVGLTRFACRWDIGYERKQGTKEFSLSSGKDRASIYTDEEENLDEGSCSEGRDQELRFGHVKLERPIGHPSGDGKYM